MTEHPIVKNDDIQSRIYTIRNVQVMLDSDLSEFYGVETKVLNQAVKRNIDRFPKEFSFQLTAEENDSLRSQFVTSNRKGGRRYLPYVFTEQGVAMLSGVLKSNTAVQISIQIINAFVAMRKFISVNAQIFHRLDGVERKQIEYKVETDEKFKRVFDAIEEKDIKPRQGIFFDGQIFDDLVKSQNQRNILK